MPLEQVLRLLRRSRQNVLAMNVCIDLLEQFLGNHDLLLTRTPLLLVVDVLELHFLEVLRGFGLNLLVVATVLLFHLKL